MTSEYTALDRMRQGDGRDGRSPVSELKLVKYDAFADADHIERSIAKNGSSWIKGTLQPEIFSIMKYDLLLSWYLKKQWRTARVGEETTLRVFSVINGLGSPGDTRMILLTQLRCAGFAGTPTREDSTGQAPKRDLPVVLGGLYNAWNTGNEVITQGDWVYWDLPKDNKEIHTIQGGKYNQGRPQNRFLALLRPYDPQNQELNVEMLRYFNVEIPNSSRMLRQNENKQIDRSVFRGELGPWALEYAESARGFMFLGVMMAASGIFGPVPGGANAPGATEDQWIDVMSNQMSGNSDFAKTVARGLSLLNETKRQPKNNGTADITRVANRLMLPKTNADRIVKRVVARKTTLEGIRKTVYQIQAGAVESNLRSGEEARQFTKKRIVGKAMQSVGPGDFFDISIGSYAI